jgi:IS1 family transposase
LQKSSPVLTAEATISSKTASPPRAASRNTSVTLAARQSREEPYPNGYTEERKEQTLSAYQERSSLRGLRRTFGVSPTTFTHHVQRLTQKTWLTLCRETRQVVAFITGDRSRAACERLWREIPENYKESTCYSDFWKAYQEVIQRSSTRPPASRKARHATSRGGSTL